MRRTRLALLRDFLAVNGGGTFTKDEILEWFRQQSPSTPATSVHLLILNATTNVPRNRNRTGRYDERGYNLLFRLGDLEHYRKYDAATDEPPVTD